MFSLILVLLGEGATQISASIGKYEAMRHRESIFALGFLSFIWTIPFLLIWGTVGPGSLAFAPASIPTFTLRIILELMMLVITIRALIEADRSTFSFLRTLTIPLLLSVDLFIGYQISTYQLIGIALVMAGSMLLATRKVLSRKGKILSLLSAIIAVGTISLFKYNITHFNSVEAEQLYSHIIIAAILWVGAYVRTGENLFAYLKKKTFFQQSLMAGIGHVFLAFSYLYTAPSVVTAARRTFEILISIVIGRKYFHEHHIAIKLGASLLVIMGISLTTFASI